MKIPAETPCRPSAVPDVQMWNWNNFVWFCHCVSYLIEQAVMTVSSPMVQLTPCFYSSLGKSRGLPVAETPFCKFCRL